MAYLANIKAKDEFNQENIFYTEQILRRVLKN